MSGKQVHVEVSLKNVEYSGSSVGRELYFTASVDGHSFYRFSSKGKGPGSIIEYKGDNNPISLHIPEDSEGRCHVTLGGAVTEDDKDPNDDSGSYNEERILLSREHSGTHSITVNVTDQQMRSKPTATFIFNFFVEVPHES